MLQLFRKALRKRRPRLILEQLEERIVLDASVAPGLVDTHVDTHHDVHHATDHHPTADSSAPGQTGQVQPVEAPHPVFHGHHGHHLDGATGSNPLSQSFERGLDVILVASDVQNPEAIKAAAKPGTDVILYDGTQDSLSIIEASLAKLVENTGEKIEHLAIVSHGDPGIINISQKDGWGVGNVEQNPTPWTELGKLLTKGAQIDFYGCDIGQGQEGAQLVASIAHLTGATVWASNNPTGSVQGADWNLEVHSGQSELSVLLDVTKLTNSGIDLDNTVITNGSFELKDASGNWYTGWTLINTPLVPTGSYFPWLSAWGIETDWNATTNPMKLGKFNSPTNAADVTNPYYDYANKYASVPLMAPGLTSQDFTAKDGHNVAFAAQNYNADMKMYQDFTLPAGTKTLSWDMSYMTYWRSPYFADDGAGGNKDQYLAVSLYDVADPAHPVFLTNLAKTAATNPTNDPHILTATSMSMTHFSFDVSAYTGKTVRLEVDVIAEQGLLTAGFDHFYVDVNHKPVAYTQGVVAYENTPMVIALGGNDSDPGAGQTLKYYLASIPATGALYATSADATAGTNALTSGAALASNTVWYKGVLNTANDTSFNFYVKDNGGGNNDTSANATVSIDSQPIFDKSTQGTQAASGITITAHAGTPVSIVLKGWDPDILGSGYLPFVKFTPTDSDPNTPGIQTPNGGTLVANGPMQIDGSNNFTQSYLYTPPANYTGSDNFSYTFSTPGSTWNKFNATGSSIGSSTDTQTTMDVEVVDLNHDGNPDIIAAKGNANGSSAGASLFYLASAPGVFGTVQAIGTDTYAKTSIAIGDFNGDGYADMVAFNYGAPVMVYIWNPSPSVNSFNAGVALANSQSPTAGFGGVAVSDLNGDGYLDVVVGRPSGADLVYKGDGHGNFDTGTSVDTSAFGVTSAIAVGDVTGDGSPDLIVGKVNASPVIVPNDGYGNFNVANKTLLPTPTGGWTGRTAQSIAVGDVNGDGTRDIVVAYTGTANVETFYKNNTNFTFTTSSDFNSGAKSMSISLADLNHDGALDVVASNDIGASKYFLFSRNNGTFTGGSGTISNEHSWGIAVADLNGDGNYDFIGDTDNSVLNKLYVNMGFSWRTSGSKRVTLTVV